MCWGACVACTLRSFIAATSQFALREKNVINASELAPHRQLRLVRHRLICMNDDTKAQQKPNCRNKFRSINYNYNSCKCKVWVCANACLCQKHHPKSVRLNFGAEKQMQYEHFCDSGCCVCGFVVAIISGSWSGGPRKMIMICRNEQTK